MFFPIAVEPSSAREPLSELNIVPVNQVLIHRLVAAKVRAGISVQKGSRWK